MSLMLDLWQQAGATFEDLCNICNRDPAQVRKELLESESIDDSFAGLVMVHNLDYKDPRNSGWLEDYIDAPLTHAENALRMVTDADGVRHMIDKDGEIVATLDGEEDAL